MLGYPIIEKSAIRVWISKVGFRDDATDPSHSGWLALIINQAPHGKAYTIWILATLDELTTRCVKGVYSIDSSLLEIEQKL